MRYLLILLFSLFTLSTYAQVESKAFKVLLETMLSKSVTTVSVEQAKKMKNVVFLDTRERQEFEVSHIKNARWVGYDTFSFANLKDIPKEANIVVYCSIGVRSEKIGERLQKAGYQHVNNLYGSIFEWVNQGNEVIDTQGKPTKKVHAYSPTWGIWLNKGEKVYK